MSVKNRAALVALSNSKLLSGGKRTTAAGIREVNSALIESLLAILDDKDVAGGYLGIDADTGKVNNNFIDFPSSENNVIPIANFFDEVGNQGSTNAEFAAKPIPGQTLQREGDNIECHYCGSLISGTSNRTISLTYGSDSIFTTNTFTVSNTTSWDLKVLIMRDTPNSIKTVATFLQQKSSGQQVQVSIIKTNAFDFSIDKQLTLTGQSFGSGVVNNETTFEFGKVTYIKSTQ